MRIKFYGKPKEITTVATSGGVDSMVLLHFLKNAGHKPQMAFFHHGTKTSNEALVFLKDISKKWNLDLIVGNIDGEKSKKESLEEWWRNQRYEFLSRFKLVALGHHLNDVAETYLFSTLNGKTKTIPAKRDNIIRPLIMTSKKDILEWAKVKEVPYIEDKTNSDLKYPRNAIRHEIIPMIEKYVNKGFIKMLRRKIMEGVNNERC